MKYIKNIKYLLLFGVVVFFIFCIVDVYFGYRSIIHKGTVLEIIEVPLWGSDFKTLKTEDKIYYNFLINYRRRGHLLICGTSSNKSFYGFCTRKGWELDTELSESDWKEPFEYHFKQLEANLQRCLIDHRKDDLMFGVQMPKYLMYLKYRPSTEQFVFYLTDFTVSSGSF